MALSDLTYDEIESADLLDVTLSEIGFPHPVTMAEYWFVLQALRSYVIRCNRDVQCLGWIDWTAEAERLIRNQKQF